MGVYIKKYLWHNHKKPLLSSWQLTLLDNESIPFIALVALMLAYAQARLWTIIRYGVRKVTRPIQLADNENPTSLSRLTQKDAILELFAALFNIGKRANKSRSMATISPWFGVGAIINFLVFVVLGALVPWALTGGLETPVVQTDPTRRISSMYTAEYVARPPRQTPMDRWLERDDQTPSKMYQKCWFNITDGVADVCEDERGILLDRPEVHSSRGGKCPYFKDACITGILPLQLEYINLTVRDLGINSNSNQLLSRRLTCAPLNITEFLRPDESSNTTWIQFGDISNLTVPSSNLEWHQLRQQITFADGRRRLDIDHPTKFQQTQATPSLQFWEEPSHRVIENMNPEGDDAELFVALFDAGGAVYNRPIDDPLFSAHLKLKTGYVTRYLPDYDYTAIACLEQQRICVPGNGCTPYTYYTSMLRQCLWLGKCPSRDLSQCYPDPKEFEKWKDFKVDGLLEACDTLVGLGKVSRKMYGQSPAVMLASSQPDLDNGIESRITTYIDPVEQWTLEVKAWFETSLLSARQIALKKGFQGSFVSEIVIGDTPHYVGKYLPSGKSGVGVLLKDGDYTNIDFAGFLLTIVAVIFIAGLSHARRIKYGLIWVYGKMDLFRSVVSRLCLRTSSFEMEPPSRTNSINSVSSQTPLQPGQQQRRESDLHVQVDGVELGAPPQAALSW
ncbi:hypothetical protein QBC38DRAFT_485374 [Podospora fimiseda]|uniref:Uncharacterized protein n=1 Tax=Podospora fimiseda TaxID=252190 RepID=A0AAN7GU63_9PEZI|nr:hypothetical protein QBC38DRAFT_485374 [Podospora fimiseda]